MKKLSYLIVAAGIGMLLSSCAKQAQTVSPNGEIRVTVDVAESEGEKDGYGQPRFTVAYGTGEAVKTILADAALGLRTELHDLAGELKLVSVSEPLRIEESYTMLTGKRSLCTNQADERVYRFENRQKQALEVVFRAYDDGVTFRYRFDSGAVKLDVIEHRGLRMTASPIGPELFEAISERLRIRVAQQMVELPTAEFEFRCMIMKQ